MKKESCIPKKIHYCWFGGNPLPYDVKKCIYSWKTKCPDYEIIEWNETNFDINCNEFIKKAYENKCWAFVSDYVRLKVIYDNGGVYLDTDVELLKNLDFLLNNNGYFAQQQNGRLINTGLGFAAKKGNKILFELIKDYENLKFDVRRKNELACPNLNTKIFLKHGYNYSNEITILDDGKTIVYPIEYFDPLSPNSSKSFLTENTVSIHHYSASWTSCKNKFKRKLFNFIGLERINRIKKMFKR